MYYLPFFPHYEPKSLHIVFPVRTDMLTIQASGWNKRKAENLDRTLAKRYAKVLTRQICIITFQFLNCVSAFVNTDISFGQTVQKITEAINYLEKLTGELALQEDTVQQWVSAGCMYVCISKGAAIQNDLQRTIEGLYLGIKQRKFQLYVSLVRLEIVQ